jgi:hypothetical protein
VNVAQRRALVYDQAWDMHVFCRQFDTNERLLSPRESVAVGQLVNCVDPALNKLSSTLRDLMLILAAIVSAIGKPHH